MIAVLRTLLARWFGPPPPIPELLIAHPDAGPAHLVPYDEHLLERARTQWQFGDWPSLAQLERNTLQHHPDRAKLALLAAAGRLQTGNDAEARQFTRLAQDWGCSKKLISQILIAGVHNSLGRAAAVGNQQQRALRHFESAINVGTPGADSRLLSQARIQYQLGQISDRQSGQPPRQQHESGYVAAPAPTLARMSNSLACSSSPVSIRKAES